MRRNIFLFSAPSGIIDEFGVAPDLDVARPHLRIDHAEGDQRIDREVAVLDARLEVLEAHELPSQSKPTGLVDIRPSSWRIVLTVASNALSRMPTWVAGIRASGMGDSSSRQMVRCPAERCDAPRAANDGLASAARREPASRRGQDRRGHLECRPGAKWSTVVFK
ncbi:MAG: hypothetical protein IPF57_09825 [Gammaproteobacteria bacterium]|nr:hypothetical protein [Gammaproteobacteria bacterium]